MENELQTSCLGLKFLGECRYYQPFYNYQIFSIGALVTALALLFTFLQYAKTITKFRIKNYRLLNIPFLSPISVFKGFLFIAIIGTIFSVILPYTPWFHKVPLIGFPQFWEIIAGILSAITFVDLIIISFTEAKFSRSNCLIFTKGILRIVVRANLKDLIDLADELSPNFRRIIKYAGKVNRHGGARSPINNLIFLKIVSKIQKLLKLLHCEKYIPVFSRIAQHLWLKYCNIRYRKPKKASKIIGCAHDLLKFYF